MNNNEDILHCSKLINILEEAVESTTLAKETLRVNCEEIKRLLTSWCLPEREVGQLGQLEQERICESPVIDESDELVKNVEETLEYAQKLRRSADIHNKNESKLRTISGAELDKLIDKGSVKLDVTITNSKKPSIDNFQHSSYPTRAVGSLREALDLQGIPPELVSILKCYHQSASELTDKHEAKGRSSTGNFLVKLMSLNRSNWSSGAHEPTVGLYSEYFSLFYEISRDGPNRKKKSRIQEMFECMERSRLRILNLNESNTPLPQAVMPSPRASEMSIAGGSWAACGVWNAKTKDLFNDMMRERGCVHYHSDHHLRKFHGNLQKIQVLLLQLEVLNTLSSELMPQLMNHNLCDTEFSSTYKTCSALSSLTALIVPSIVRVV